MAGIPPNWLGSVVGGHQAAERASERSAKERAAQAESGGENFAGRLQDVVEAGEGSNEVYSDAEGQGSQGRATAEPPDDVTQSDAGADAAETDRPTGGLDLEA